MKRLLFTLFLTLFISSSANANSFSEYVSNLIPGDGDTEVSIDLRENNSPDYSILLVRELDRNCLLYTSPSPRDRTRSRMPSSA